MYLSTSFLWNLYFFTFLQPRQPSDSELGSVKSGAHDMPTHTALRNAIRNQSRNMVSFEKIFIAFLNHRIQPSNIPTPIKSKGKQRQSSNYQGVTASGRALLNGKPTVSLVRTRNKAFPFTEFLTSSTFIRFYLNTSRMSTLSTNNVKLVWPPVRIPEISPWVRLRFQTAGIRLSVSNARTTPLPTRQQLNIE